MACRNKHSFGMWLAIAVAISAASMSSSESRKAERAATTVEQSVPRVHLTLPLN